MPSFNTYWVNHVEGEWILTMTWEYANLGIKQNYRSWIEMIRSPAIVGFNSFINHNYRWKCAFFALRILSRGVVGSLDFLLSAPWPVPFVPKSLLQGKIPDGFQQRRRISAVLSASQTCLKQYVLSFLKLWDNVAPFMCCSYDFCEFRISIFVPSDYKNVACKAYGCGGVGWKITFSIRHPCSLIY